MGVSTPDLISELILKRTKTKLLSVFFSGFTLLSGKQFFSLNRLLTASFRFSHCYLAVL